MTLFRPAISLLLLGRGVRLNRFGYRVLPDHQVTEHVFGQIEVALERPDLSRLKTEVGHGVKAFGEAADGVCQAAPPPLVDVFDLAAPLLYEVAHTFDGRGESLIA